MAGLRRPVFAAVAMAAAQQASAQLGLIRPSSTSGSFGTDQASQTAEAAAPARTSNTEGDGFGSDQGQSDSSIASTVTTSNSMGQPLTLTYTYPVQSGSIVIKTTNLLQQSTTLILPLPTSTTQSSSSSRGASQTTYTTTDSYGQAHTITTDATAVPEFTSSTPSNSAASSSSMASSTQSDVGPAAVSTSLPASTPVSTHTSSGMSPGAIAAAVVVPVVVVLAAIALALLLFYRKRRNSGRATEARDVAGIEGGPGMRERDRSFPLGNVGTTSTAVDATAQQQGNARPLSGQSVVGDQPPVIGGTPGTAWHSSSDASALGSSYSSTQSDPFKDPGGAMPTATAAISPPQTHERPVSPLSESVASTPGNERLNPMDRTIGILSPTSENDEEPQIMEGEIAHVAQAQRASVVRMRPSPPKTSPLNP